MTLPVAMCLMEWQHIGLIKKRLQLGCHSMSAGVACHTTDQPILIKAEAQGQCEAIRHSSRHGQAFMDL